MALVCRVYQFVKLEPSQSFVGGTYRHPTTKCSTNKRYSILRQTQGSIGFKGLFAGVFLLACFLFQFQIEHILLNRVDTQQGAKVGAMDSAVKYAKGGTGAVTGNLAQIGSLNPLKGLFAGRLAAALGLAKATALCGPHNPKACKEATQFGKSLMTVETKIGVKQPSVELVVSSVQDMMYGVMKELPKYVREQAADAHNKYPSWDYSVLAKRDYPFEPDSEACDKLIKNPLKKSFLKSTLDGAQVPWPGYFKSALKAMEDEFTGWAACQVGPREEIWKFERKPGDKEFQLLFCATERAPLEGLRAVVGLAGAAWGGKPQRMPRVEESRPVCRVGEFNNGEFDHLFRYSFATRPRPVTCDVGEGLLSACRSQGKDCRQLEEFFETCGMTTQ